MKPNKTMNSTVNSTKVGLENWMAIKKELMLASVQK